MGVPERAHVCTGACLCGAVRYRLAGPFGPMVHCHCSMCRKAHGSSFATFVGAPASGFEWIAGEDDIASYASSAQGMRHFCRTCGSVTPPPTAAGAAPAPDELTFVPAGNLVEDCGARPSMHMFAGSKAPWVTLDDELTRFDAAPPGYDAPPVRPEPRPGTPGAVSGSCLCGAVRFEFVGKPQLMGNCHCSRCRRGRSAAHATNLFVLPEQLRWLQGEDTVRVFDLPGAERFGIDFCPTCGGPVPRPSPKIGRVNVPAGSLDADPGMTPTFHIFVESKAPWFEIRDEVPRFPESMPFPRRR